MKKKKPEFNAKERAILQAINKSRRGLTIYEVSQKTGISWITAKKYIKYLKKSEIFILLYKGNVIYDDVYL